MSARARRRNALRRERIDLLRLTLIEALAERAGMKRPRCANGCRVPLHELEIDHVNGCSWSRAAVGRESRHLRYVRELREGVPLQLLCRPCNAAKNQHGLREAWASFWKWASKIKRAA